tara:strand:+ start:258 stop:794 length:537 start_codon:yes stop_codon:yes gene_type:complete
MSRIFTLRGKMEVTDNASYTQEQIFDYVSSDRRKAWKVKRAWIWPITARTSAGGGADGQYQMQGILSTDKWTKATTPVNNVADPSDNRQFGWVQAGYSTRDGPNDFLAPQSMNYFPEFVIDVDTIIVKELWLTISAVDETGNSAKREWAYVIEVEEIKISPEQSVFQQIKGMGQSLLN